MMPLKDVMIKGNVNGTISTVSVQLQYVLASGDQQIECNLNFSVNSKSIVSSLSAKIEGKLIKAMIREKEEAKEKYDDAIAADNTVIIGKSSNNKKNCIIF